MLIMLIDEGDQYEKDTGSGDGGTGNCPFNVVLYNGTVDHRSKKEKINVAFPITSNICEVFFRE